MSADQRYVYHFCAEWQTSMTNIQRFDGLAEMVAPVLTREDYHQLKTIIKKTALNTPDDASQITILSLSRLGEREVKGSEQ